MTVPSATPAGTRPGLGRKLALSVVVAALLIVVGELAARVAVARLPRFASIAARDWAVLTPDTGWERRPNWSGKVYGSWREFGERGILVEDQAGLGAERPRVVLLGDSCTFGHRVPVEQTFARLLERELPGVDVVNLGVPGYSSFQALRLLEKLALSLEPDVVLVSTNYNDRRYVRRPRDYEHDWAATAAAARGLVASSRLVAVLRGLRGENEEEARPVAGLSFDDLLPRVVPGAYGANLERAAELIEGAGAQPVFLLLGDDPEQTAELRRGMRLAEEGRHAEAVPVFEAVEQRGGTFAVLARLRRVKSLSQLGRTEETRAAALLPTFVPSLLGGVPLVADEVYHAEMRAAASSSGALLVDGAAALAAEDYFDFCHFGPTGHAKLARTLAEALRPLL